MTTSASKKRFGDAVRDAVRGNRIAGILIGAPGIEAGPFDGGCRVLARALLLLVPGGRVVTIEGQVAARSQPHRLVWQAEHYGFEFPGGGVVDGDGYAATRGEWMRRFVRNELVNRPVRVVAGETPSQEVPTDARVERRLALEIRRHLKPKRK